MNFWHWVFIFILFTLHRGHGGFLSKFTSRGRNGNNQANDFVDVCETVRVMPRMVMAVVGGSPLKHENSAPYITAVGERTENGSVSWFCGGSLISSQHVLTAAHCLVSRNVSTVRVGSFSTKTRSTDNDYEILETIIHPGYKITVSYNDIGILKLKDRITLNSNIKPVCLPQNSNENYEKERAKVIGWGAQEFGGEGTQKLQQVEVEVFSNANCEKAYSNSTIAPKTFPKGIKNEQLCAGSKKGGKDACQGDSGGPLVLTDEEGIVRQIGVVSTGAGCGFKMYPGVYTRVSSYTDWIREQIKDSGAGQPSQKEFTSKNDTDKKSTLPSRPPEDPQQQGTLLSSQSLNNHNRSRINIRPQNTEKYSSSHKQTQNSRETHSGKDSQQESNGKQNNKISDTNSVVNSISNSRKTKNDSREVSSRERGHWENAGLHGEEQTSSRPNLQNEHHRVRRRSRHATHLN